MLTSAHEDTKNGKMIQYYNSKVDSPPPEPSLSTDIYCHRVSVSQRLGDQYYPEYLRWGQASTTAAILNWDRCQQHAGDFESVVCGARLFLLGVPKVADEGKQFLYEPKAYGNPKALEFVTDHWEIEAVIVPAGSEM